MDVEIDDEPGGEEIKNCSYILLEKSVSSAKNDNYLFSPIILVQIVSLLLPSTQKSTQSQIRKGLKLPSDLSHVKLNRINRKFITYHDKMKELTIKHLILFNDPFVPSDKYKEILETQYKATVELVDLTYNSDETFKMINKWGRSSSKGRIPFLLRNPAAKDNEIMIFSICFYKSNWFYKIRSFHDDEFNINLRKSVHIDYYRFTQKFNYLEQPCGEGKLKVVQIPFNSGASIIIFLPPKTSSLISFLYRYSLKSLVIQLTSSTPSDYVDVFIPKFKYLFSPDLADYFSSLGVIDIFKSSAVVTEVSNDPHVSSVLSYNYIEINEQLNETNNLCVEEPCSKIFIADRPFIFVIWDSTNIPIFTGVLHDPTQEFQS